MLVCPQCSNLLVDHLAEYEAKLSIKTVKCTNCDYLGKREGFNLLTLEQIKEYNMSRFIKVISN